MTTGNELNEIVSWVIWSNVFKSLVYVFIVYIFCRSYNILANEAKTEIKDTCEHRENKLARSLIFITMCFFSLLFVYSFHRTIKAIVAPTLIIQEYNQN